jgi:hypothetical protein
MVSVAIVLDRDPTQRPTHLIPPVYTWVFHTPHLSIHPFGPDATQHKPPYGDDRHKESQK